MTARPHKGRRPALLAVSKLQPATAVAALPPCGAPGGVQPVAFGENYVQEALAKQPSWRRWGSSGI